MGRVARGSIVIEHRADDPRDQAIVARIRRIFEADRRTSIRSQAKSFEDRAADEEIELTVQKVTSLIEPVLILFLAVAVGFVVMAVLLPILQIGQSVD